LNTPVNQGIWSANYNFAGSGDRQIKILGFDSLGKQIAVDTISIFIKLDQQWSLNSWQLFVYITELKRSNDMLTKNYYFSGFVVAATISVPLMIGLQKSVSAQSLGSIEFRMQMSMTNILALRDRAENLENSLSPGNQHRESWRAKVWPANLKQPQEFLQEIKQNVCWD
jgi:hypothetical protein